MRKNCAGAVPGAPVLPFYFGGLISAVAAAIATIDSEIAATVTSITIPAGGEDLLQQDANDHDAKDDDQGFHRFYGVYGSVSLLFCFQLHLLATSRLILSRHGHSRRFGWGGYDNLGRKL
jgi:hypothetical protein